MKEKISEDRLKSLGNLATWLSVSYDLSLDCITPFHKEMGLSLANSEKLTAIFRPCVKKINQKGVISESIISALKEQIENKYGDNGLRVFIKWLSTTYDPNQHWRDWRFLLEVSGNDYYQDLRFANINEEKISKLMEYENYCFYWTDHLNDPINQRLEEFRNLPLSQWDLEFCQINNCTNSLNLINPETETTDIFSSAIDVISMNRFQSGWETLWGNFSPEEVAQVIAVSNNYLNRIPNNEREIISPDLFCHV